MASLSKLSHQDVGVPRNLTLLGFVQATQSTSPVPQQSCPRCSTLRTKLGNMDVHLLMLSNSYVLLFHKHLVFTDVEFMTPYFRFAYF